jgi:hypothetical protein
MQIRHLVHIHLHRDHLTVFQISLAVLWHKISINKGLILLDSQVITTKLPFLYSLYPLTSLG